MSLRCSTSLLLAAMALAVSHAQASTLNVTGVTPGTVLYDSSTPVNTDPMSNPPNAFDSTTAISVPAAGELYVTLTDQGTPLAFATLNFALTDLTTTLVPLGPAGTVESIDLTSAQTISAYVTGVTQGNYGLYTLEATFEPQAAVPVPTTSLLLVGGLAVLRILQGGRWTGCNTVAIRYA